MLALGVFSLNATEPNLPTIWNTEKNLLAVPDEIIEKAKEFDVIVLGEEHDNKTLHQFYESLSRSLASKYSVSFSFEMLEWDQQPVVDEFLSGIVSEDSFLSSLSLWKNFKEDYFPLVRFAKEKGISVVCANPPRRYVNRIAKKGLSAYQDFPKFLPFPEAYTLRLGKNPEYETRLRDIFQSHGGENFLFAQAAWDQGMAESISREIYRSQKKLVHRNGRFHSDRMGGVVFRLQEMGHKVLVISGFWEKAENPTEYSKIAHFVILTNGR